MTPTSTAEDGLGTGPKSHQKLRRIKRAPGPIVPPQCLNCGNRCACKREIPANPGRFLECWKPDNELIGGSC